MRINVLDIMQNDSLTRQLLRDYNYNRGLVDEKYLQSTQLDEDNVVLDDTISDTIGHFFDKLMSFLHHMPAVVWVILGVFMISLVVYILFRNGVFSIYKKHTGEAFDAEDNIYDIDYDSEMAAAVRDNNYPAIVRLVYLSTLRQLDERGKVVWRIYKTPTQFATEMNNADFSKMTRHFLQIRYGKFPASKALCDEMSMLGEQVLKGGDR